VIRCHINGGLAQLNNWRFIINYPKFSQKKLFEALGGCRDIVPAIIMGFCSL
jgi:hypothetical protein